MRVTDALLESAFDRDNIADLKNLALLLVDERNDLEELLELARKTQPTLPGQRISVAQCVSCNRTHMHVSCPRGHSDALKILMERAMASQAKGAEF